MDTHLSQIYGTNHVPSDIELLEIERLIAPHSARLVHLEKDLEEAEARVVKLKREKDEILRVIRPLKSLSSLIRRFPREIMELIFINSISTTTFGRTIFNICHAPLVFLRVCRLWREIALTTPQLWVSVELAAPVPLCYSSVSPQDAKRQQRSAMFLEQFDQWLKRSESCPLSITVRGSPSNEGTSTEILASKLAILSHRWESIDFNDPRGLPNPFTGIVAQSLPILKRARLTAHSLTFGTGDNRDFGNFLAAPNLERLQIQVSRSSHALARMPINWTNLTHLFLDGLCMYHQDISSRDEPLTAAGVLPVLEKCQNLRVFSLLMTPRNSLPEPRPQVSLSNLEALNVAGCRSQIDHLLRSITTPRIREIHYQPFSKVALPTEELPFTAPFPLTSFLQRYGNKIEVLSVNLHIVAREDLQSWLECTPGLKQLSIGPEFETASVSSLFSVPNDSENPFDDSCLALLTPNRDQTHLCPNLRIFRCSIKGRISGDAVLKFLKARTDPLSVRHGRPIEEVWIHQLPYDFPFGDLSDVEDEMLQPIREAGVRLSFRKSSYFVSRPIIVHGPPYAYIPGSGPGYGIDFKLF